MSRGKQKANATNIITNMVDINPIIPKHIKSE
jgi:hypothetical protein